MHIPLDREQDVPLYLQIEEALRRAILTGVFVDGDKLPSTRTLAAELAVSRLTVDNAYAELAAKGFLHQRRGSGAYVAHPQAQTRPARPTSNAPFPLESFTTLTSRLDGYADAPLPEGLINFAAGVGSPKIFPLEAFRKVLLSVLSRHAEEAFSYGEYCGYYPLRDTLSRILSAQGIPTQAEQVLITNGSQHAISLVVQSLLAIAQQAGVVILEDDFVGDLRYQGKQLPSLRALAQPGAVIYVSTFSKMLLPSMRIGYLVADSEHYQRFARLKHVDSFTSSSLIQRALDAFVTVGRYDKQLRRAGRVYRLHLEVMIDALQHRLPPGCRFEMPQGGLFIWLTLPKAVTTAELMPVAWRHGVTFARGECFYAQEQLGAHGLRLNFAANSPPQIEEGIARLCRAIEEVITEKNAG